MERVLALDRVSFSPLPRFYWYLARAGLWLIGLGWPLLLPWALGGQPPG